MSKAIIQAGEGRLDLAAGSIEPFGRELDLVEVASRRKGLDYRRDWDYGSWLILPELSVAKAICKGLCVRAIVAASKGDVTGSARELGCALRVSDLTTQEPILIAALVAVAQRAIIYRAFEECAASFPKNLTDLGAFQCAFGDGGTKSDLRRALRGEAYMGLATMRNLDAWGGIRALRNASEGDPSTNGPPLQLARTGVPSSLTERAMLDRYLRFWTRADAIIRGKDEISATKALDAAEKRDSEKNTESYLFEAIILPEFSQVGTAYKSCEAQGEATRGLLAAMVYRAINGAFPRSVSQLPGTWIDPFDGKPLRISVRGDAIRVYSVGPDLVDNRGLIRSNDSKRYDIVAAYPPKSARN